MISPVSSAQVQAQPPVQPSSAPAPKSQPIVADTVQISLLARSLQETLESSAQTTREASSGDAQAVRLLAKEAAAHAITK